MNTSLKDGTSKEETKPTSGSATTMTKEAAAATGVGNKQTAAAVRDDSTRKEATKNHEPEVDEEEEGDGEDEDEDEDEEEDDGDEEEEEEDVDAPKWEGGLPRAQVKRPVVGPKPIKR